MSSNDIQTLTVRDFQSGLDGLKVYIDGRLLETEKNFIARIGEVNTEVRINSVRIEEVKNSMNWNFTTLAVVVAIVGFTITLAPMFREIFIRRKEEKTRDDIRKIVREIVREELKGGVANDK